MRFLSQLVHHVYHKEQETDEVKLYYQFPSIDTYNNEFVSFKLQFKKLIRLRNTFINVISLVVRFNYFSDVRTAHFSEIFWQARPKTRSIDG